MTLDTRLLLISYPEARSVMFLNELALRSAGVELQSYQRTLHTDHQRLRGPGSMLGAQLATTEPVMSVAPTIAST